MNRADRRAVDHDHAGDRLVTPAELAVRWGCSRQHVYNLMSAGLPSVRLGRARRIRLDDADDYLDAHRVDS